MRPLLAFVLMFMLAFVSEGRAEQPVLHRGINLSCWLGNAPRQNFTRRDFDNIKNAGFDFVRVPVNPEFFGFSLSDDAGRPANMDFRKIDAALEEITQSGLAVVLDIHPSGEFMDSLEAGGRAEDRFVSLWASLAERYKKYPSTVLAYELLNEPQYYNAATAYNRLVGKSLAAIRTVDKQRLVIIEAPAVVSLYPVEGLKLLDTLNDSNIAYDVHFYQPYIITHQGLHSGFDNKQIRYIYQLPYPAAEAAKMRDKIVIMPGANVAKADKEINTYIAEGWNADKINQYIAPVGVWARERKARVLMLEFGVFRNYIDRESRYRWIGDVRRMMDAQNIGWALWDYGDMMGIVRMIGETVYDAGDGSYRFVDPAKGVRSFEPGALEALGTQAK